MNMIKTLKSNKFRKFKGLLLLFVCLFSSCQVQFKMNGSSIDYTQIKTMTIVDFVNRTAFYPPMEQVFNEALKDIYTRQTRLMLVPRNGDLQLEGEITGYDITPMAIGSNSIAQETKLTITIKVRFVNTKDQKQSFESTMSAYQSFQSSRNITEVQDELMAEIVKELSETIFNRTVANW